MKTTSHTITTLPDGRIVVVDPEQEIMAGEWGIPECLNESFNNKPIRFLRVVESFSDCIDVCDEKGNEFTTIRNLYVGGKGKIVFTINFNLPGVTELEVVEENDGDIIENVIKSIPDFPYILDNFFEDKIVQFGLRCYKKAATGHKYSEATIENIVVNYLSLEFGGGITEELRQRVRENLKHIIPLSLTTPNSIAEVRVEWEENKIKSVSGKDQQGNTLSIIAKS